MTTRILVLLAFLPAFSACDSEDPTCDATSEQSSDSCVHTYQCPETDDMAATTNVVDCDCGGVDCASEAAPASAPYTCRCLKNGAVTATFESVDTCLSETDVQAVAEQQCGFDLRR